MFTKKRGIQLNEAFGAVMIVILIAILVIIAIFLFEALNTNFVSKSVATVNETSAYINATVYTADNAGVCNFNTFAVTSAINVSDNVTLAVGNYTVDSTAGTITNATVATYDDVLLSYTYNWGGEACDATEGMITQFATYPALIGLVGTIVFLGLVIGILMVAFVFGGKRREV